MIDRRWFKPVFFLLGCVMLFGGLQAQDPFKPTPQVDSAAVADAAFLADPGPVKLNAFRKVLLAQVDQAVKSGELTRTEAFKLRLATLSPKVLTKVHQACCEHAVSEGVATSVTAIDWAKVAEIIKTLLPVILQIISLFS